MNYFIEIFDQDNITRIAQIENAFNIKIIRTISTPLYFSFHLPVIDSKLDETFTDSQGITRPIIDIGNIVKVLINTEGEALIFGTEKLFGDGWIVGKEGAGSSEAVGIITGPLDKNVNPVTVSAVGLASKLGYYITPALWEIEDTPANILRALLKEHRFIRLTTGADWDAGTYTQTQKIDGADAGGQSWYILLGSTGTSPLAPYYSSGDWISTYLNVATDLTAWEKIKFKAGINQEGTLTFQTRTGAVFPPDGTWESWTWPIDIDASCEDGYPITSTVQQYIQVKINFATEDDEFSPVVQAIEIQGTYGDILIEGTGFSDLPTDTIPYNPTYENQLNLLNTVLSETGKDVLEGSTYVWKDAEWMETSWNAFNVGVPLGIDQTNRYTLHEYQHFEMLEYEEDDSNIVNYVVGLGAGVGLNQLIQIAQDVDSQKRYGRRVGLFESITEKTGSSLADAATAYLNKYKNPTRSVRIRVIDTPDGTWYFKVGDTIRLISPNRTLDTNLRIVKESRQSTQQTFTAELVLTNPAPAIKSFVSEYLKEQQEFAAHTDSAIKNYESGDLWTDWIHVGDVAWHSVTIQLGFTPTDGHIIPIQVLEETTGYYTQPGKQFDFRICNLRTSEIEFEYRQIEKEGENRVRIQFLWTVWGKRETFSAIGLGGQIE